MTTEPKIIGMWHDRDKDAEDAQLNPESSISESTVDTDNDWDVEEIYEEETVDWVSRLTLGVFALSIAAWTGFFGWANLSLFSSALTATVAVDLIAKYAMPVAAMTALYLLVMRSSTRQARRFSDVSLSLNSASAELESRLTTINNELSIARTFLASESQALESLGRQSVEKLNESTSGMQSAFADSESKMKTLEEVSSAAHNNMERLRNQLPVVTNAAKDVTNQIGNAGRTAQAQVDQLNQVLAEALATSEEARIKIDAMEQKSVQTCKQLSITVEEVKSTFAELVENAGSSSTSISETLIERFEATISALNENRISLEKQTEDSSKAVSEELATVQSTFEKLSAQVDKEQTKITEISSKIRSDFEEASVRVAEIEENSAEKTAKIGFAVAALEENSTNLNNSLKSGHDIAETLIKRTEDLMVALDSSAREIDETLPAAMQRLDDRYNESQSKLAETGSAIEALETITNSVLGQIDDSELRVKEHVKLIEELMDRSDEDLVAKSEQIEALTAAIRSSREESENLTEVSGERLVGALLRAREAAQQAAQHAKQALENSISDASTTLASKSEEALNKVIEEKVTAMGLHLESSLERTFAVSNDAAEQLSHELSKVDELTDRLEQRVALARASAEEASDDNFVRRVALLTESLNSSAIDVTKILSNEVTDTAWAAYLKGDRGVFTRRAVKLLDAGEVRDISSQYENDAEFHDHVNRYIHDFESMLRNLLSARDGSALSVTLLSSDMGKLYVALAQAIERLRT